MVFWSLSTKTLSHTIKCISRCIYGKDCYIKRGITGYFGRASYSSTQRSVFTHCMDDYVTLKEEKLVVNPGFGVLHAAGTVDLIIKPASPQDYPDADRALVSLHGPPSALSPALTVEVRGEHRQQLHVSATAPEPSPVVCQVQVPIKYDLEVQLEGQASVQVEGLENEEVRVSTEAGEVRARGLRSGSVSMHTHTGPLNILGAFRGNLHLQAHSTHLQAKCLQGEELKVEAEQLTMQVESSYMRQGHINAQQAHITLRNLHGCNTVNIQRGQVNITGLQGQISGSVGEGEIGVQVIHFTDNSTLHINKGNLHLSLSDNIRYGVTVTAPSIQASTQVSQLGATITKGDEASTLQVKGEGQPTHTLTATVQEGAAHIKCQDWFSSLGIL